MRSINQFKPLWLASTVLVAVTSIAGCGGSGSAGGSQPGKAAALPDISGPEPSIPPLAKGADEDPSKPLDFKGGSAAIRPDGSMTFPLDAYDSAADEALLAQAQTVLGQQCMRAKGLELPASLKLDKGPEQPAPYVIFGVMDLKTVKVSGYREPSPATAPSPAPSASPGAGQQADGDIPPAVAQAFFDDPRKGKLGCEGEAREKLLGKSPETMFTLLQQYRSEALTAAQGDSRVRSVTAKWSACMKDSGFLYPNPLAPGHDRTLLGRGLPTPKGASLPPPSPAEIEVAVTDIKCKRQTGYLQTIALVNAAYQQQISRKQAQHLDEMRQRQQRNTAAARKILAGGK
ncbi:hypothetical protein [Streptomyces orinoci]|uniref:Secreted protein n=1 Tax=Streptomyces orinoci TaxID=67339 RepID=A0ABV3JU76_STRON|nr:hypothetical protein [Streptomyces orinoci]